MHIEKVKKCKDAFNSSTYETVTAFLLYIHNDFCACPIVRMLSPMELNISLWRPLGNEHLWPLRTRQSTIGTVQ